MINGFILTSNIRTSDNKSYLELAGVLENKKPFLWLQSKPYLCAFAREGENVPNSIKRQSGLFKSFQHTPLDLIHFNTIDSLREEIHNPTSNLLEIDVEPTHRFLAENKIKGSVTFVSPGEENENGTWVFTNPKVKPSKTTVPLKAMSFDIETGVKSDDFLDATSNPLYSIAYTDGEEEKVLMIADEAGTDGHIEYVEDEATLIKTFIKEVQRTNPQVFIGWNVVNFDFHFLIKKCELHGIPFKLGVDDREIDHFTGKTGNDLYVRMTGRVIMDGIPMMRLLGVKLPNYKLDTAAKVLIGEGKTITSTDTNKVEEIENYFLNDKKKLAEYNLVDTKLVYEIYKKLDVIKFQQLKVKWSGVLIDKLSSETDIFDSIYLPQLHRTKYAAPKPTQATLSIEPTLTSLTSLTGEHFFEHVFTIDFKHIDAYAIMLYKIDPLGRVLAEQDEQNSVSSPMGLKFHKLKTILPKLIEHYLSLKQKYKDKETHHKVLDHLIELITSAVTKDTCRFYSPALTNAILSGGQFFRDRVKSTLRNCGYTLVNEEKDRLYVSNSSPVNEEEIQRLIETSQSELKKTLVESNIIQADDPHPWVPFLETGSTYDYFFITQMGNETNPKSVYLANSASNWYKSGNLIRGDITEIYTSFEKDLFSAIFRKQKPNRRYQRIHRKNKPRAFR